MTRHSPYRPFIPNPEQMALKPAISGNTINGLGKKKLSQAKPVYWHEPDSLAHGEMQKWFYTQNPDNEAIGIAREERARIMAMQVEPIQGEPVKRSAQEWTDQLKDFSDSCDLDLFGITPVQEQYFFKGHEPKHKWAIMVGFSHDYEQIKHAPEDVAGAEVVRQYGRSNKVVKEIANFIRRQGWDAEHHSGPLAGPILLIPHAIACGFGELGKHGSIINREFGSSFRLGCVLTNIPLVETQAESYGVDDFCSRCQVCTDACPPDAILQEKQVVRGETKWYVDFDKCIPFFNEHYGCAICIAVCPWSRPGRGPRIVEQLARRAARKSS